MIRLVGAKNLTRHLIVSYCAEDNAPDAPGTKKGGAPVGLTLGGGVSWVNVTCVASLRSECQRNPTAASTD